MNNIKGNELSITGATLRAPFGSEVTGKGSLILLSKGEFNYHGESNREHQAQYWIAQIGEDVVAICSPMDSHGDGYRDHNVLLNRDEYRLAVTDHLRNIHGEIAPPLTIFVLCVHQRRKDVYGLAFKMAEVADFEKRRHLSEVQMAALIESLAEQEIEGSR